MRLNRTTWDHLVQTPCFQQGNIQVGFECLQRRLHHLSVQPVSVPSHPHSEKVFSHMQTELAVFQFKPIDSYPVARHHRKKSGPILWISSLEILVHISKTSFQSSILQAEQAQLSKPFLIRDPGSWSACWPPGLQGLSLQGWFSICGLWYNST